MVFGSAHERGYGRNHVPISMKGILKASTSLNAAFGAHRHISLMFFLRCFAMGLVSFFFSSLLAMALGIPQFRPISSFILGWIIFSLASPALQSS